MDGKRILKEKIKQVSSSPGVYRMLNEEGEVLYIGKAKNLKKRLTSYIKEENNINRIRKMVFETRDLIIIETSNQTEALLLEINLIKSLKPKYNVIFKDDSHYPYIFLSEEEVPRLSYRRNKQENGIYFGPYPDVKAMHNIIDMIEHSFLLRTCKNSEFKNRTRPCLKYHIKRCSAPCVGKILSENYNELVKEAKDFLQGKANDIQKEIQNKMLYASKNMNFEQAAIFRDRLKYISSVMSSNKFLGFTDKDVDIIAVYVENKVSIQLYSYKNGMHVGDIQIFPKYAQGLSEGEVLRLFIANHYNENNCPRIILTSHLVADKKYLIDILSKDRKVSISMPLKGIKKEMTMQALENAKQALKRKQAEDKSWKIQLLELAKLINFKGKIKRIETFDISNIQGKHAVASMVVAGETGMLKSDYRKFAIKGKNAPDDYAMMYEVLKRRYYKVFKNTKNKEIMFPDIIMVDGGKGHLSVLKQVMQDIKADKKYKPILLAIAKGEFRDKGLETIFCEGLKEPLNIGFNSPLKFLLQTIRDESHRFAIGYYRSKHSKSLFKSDLDNIEGIGAKRKKSLLLTFGSLEGVKNASLSELKGVEGINHNLAKIIYNYFHL